MFYLDNFRLYRLLLTVLMLITFLACGDSNSNKGGNVLDSYDSVGVGQGDQLTATGTVTLSSLQSGSIRLKTSDPSAPFTSDLPSAVAPVTVNSPATVNFVIKDRGGNVISDLQGNNLRFAIAKLMPGSRGQFGVDGTGEADQWVSYIYRTKTGTAVTDGVQATYENGVDGNLVYNEENKYYSYTFAQDLTTATRPDDSTLIWDESAVHRLAIQLEILDNNGKRILYNPHFDFTFDNGSAVPLSDTSLTHKVVDESSCNECHKQLTAHGGRVETEYCVMCHNSGSIDVEFGSDLDFKVMIHRIHAGKSLTTEYKISGYDGTVHEWSDIGYPQDLRNCSKCHDSSNPLTPQADNWIQQPTQQACISCHENVDFNNHKGLDMISDVGVRDNSKCAGCHSGQSFSQSAHLNQAEHNSINYQIKLNDFSFDSNTRIASVNYSIINPGNTTAYDLTEGLSSCRADVVSGTVTADSCLDLEGAPFSRVKLTIGTLTLNSVAPALNEYSDYSTSSYAWQGDDNGDGSYSLSLTLPTEAVGSARLLVSGQAQERRISDLTAYNYAVKSHTSITQINATANGIDWDWSHRVRVPIDNATRDFSIDGSIINARREIVSDTKCNNCHSMLGSVTGSNTQANAFHNGENNTVASCPVCHTSSLVSDTDMGDEIVEGVTVEPLIPGTSTRMKQSLEFKTMIHAIHAGEKRATAYLLGTSDLSGDTHYPGMIADCTACHENNSYGQNGAKLASAVSAESDISQRKVFSPFAASCMGCHDKAAVREHMSTQDAGGAAVGDYSQAQWISGQIYERCGECHSRGAVKDVHVVHALD